MNHIIELNREEIICAISDYLTKKGYTMSKKYYSPCVAFTFGKVDIGTQREPQTIETVISAKCILEE